MECSVTEKTIETLGVSDLVDILKAGDDAPNHPKPDPFHANCICSSLGLKPAELMMVGDTVTDMLFAKVSYSLRYNILLDCLQCDSNHQILFFICAECFIGARNRCS